MANVLERLDSQLASFFSDWDLSTTVLALLISALVLYPILFPVEPDTHPLLLARQSAISPVRNKFESAIYRTPEVPPGTPLRTGLNVKDLGAPRWATGKDGDLRDIWREVQRGGAVKQTTEPGAKKDGDTVPKGLIMTLFGREEIVEHDVEQLSREIQIIGSHLKDKKIKRVAIYLPNTVEYLLTIFACSFYGITPALLPYNLPHPVVYGLVKETGADALICAAGSLPLDEVAKECAKLRLLTWVVEKTSRHMDWAGAPDFAKKRLAVSVWHDVVEEAQAKATSDLPSNDTGDAPVEILTVWFAPTKPEVISFTHANMVSAIAALISALPHRQRFSPADMVLSADSFHQPYVLCQTLAALFTHANLAITSVAQPGVDLGLATRGVSPTVIIASPETLAALHKVERANKYSLVEEMARYGYSRSLAAGRLPQPSSLLFRLLAPSSTAAKDTKPGKLRLILTSERSDARSPRLTSQAIADLRIFTRSRICYALTAAKVAGAVAQTHVFDYKVLPDNSRHFGIPLSSVEVCLEDKNDDSKLGGPQPEGELVVRGPAVSGYDRSSGKGQVKTGARASFGEDGTLTLIH